jgi:hypothetical protein
LKRHEALRGYGRRSGPHMYAPTNTAPTEVALCFLALTLAVGTAGIVRASFQTS